LNHQKAYKITLALAAPQIGAIKIVSKGKASPERGKAAEFRYLFPQAENGASETEDYEPF
jgi:hypothetical protein